nr:PREDICTED: uncharacterized protein LOC108209815 isoform X2 [Daucus carota subsp. sativus]
MASLCVYISSSCQSNFHFSHTQQFNPYKTPFLHSKPTTPLQISHKSSNFNTTLTFSTSQSSSSSTLLDPLKPGRTLTNNELEKLQFLENFRYFQELKSGSVLVRVMRDDEIDMTVGLLTESFADSMMMRPKGSMYVNLLGILVKQYLTDRRFLMPHTATLIGYYKGDDEDSEVELAGTVEISFNKMGANDKPPTPSPPRDSPYICNMAVLKSLRRYVVFISLRSAKLKMLLTE